MNMYQSIEQPEPTYGKITNQFTITNDKSRCNPLKADNNFGNYFQTCEAGSAYWGSDKPVRDDCITPQVGKPCNSLWNNLTKRKSVVSYER